MPKRSARLISSVRSVSAGSAAGVGEQGRILLTDLANHVMPFINYESGDDAVNARQEARRAYADGHLADAGMAWGTLIHGLLEHAMRHLSWLVRDDPAVRDALGGWTEVLAGFEPEPFQSLA